VWGENEKWGEEVKKIVLYRIHGVAKMIEREVEVMKLDDVTVDVVFDEYGVRCVNIYRHGERVPDLEWKLGRWLRELEKLVDVLATVDYVGEVIYRSDKVSIKVSTTED